MTFYWWSHWFWITCLCVQFIHHVHTYPSQDFGLESTTSQQREDAIQSQSERLPTTATTRDEPHQRQSTTRLYQTTASQSWSTATQRNVMDLTIKTTTATSRMTPSYPKQEQEQEQQQQPDDEPEVDIADAVIDEVVEEIDEVDADVDANVKLTISHNQFEFKRSADFAAAPADLHPLPAEQLNNYTNFSRITSTNSSNSIGSNSTSNEEAASASLSAAAALDANMTTARSSTVATTSSPQLNSTGQTLSATPSTPKIHTEWLSDELQKAPFTLENANKEDELRRAESEHRSRKSKVLSAEYKHINRYINFSSDTKSLLTRSASSTPSISGYNPDEGNISSEALAIQRTYFLDAGAISAICFTVFGICCTVGTIGIVLYRRRYLNKPQALSEPDSSVYIDDSTMRDNSDEMYSLDNDSFLNSLEAMTIQNYWTDTVKHTKL